MSKSILAAAHFHDEAAAYAYVEARLWPDGQACPHCGVVGNAAKLAGESTRIGTYKCREKPCRRKFTVKIGTLFEDSHIPMHIWLQGIHLLASSKKGFSSNQFARTLGVSLKAAWFLSMRLREAMRSVDVRPFGARGGVVEVDETFWGRNPDKEISGTALRHMNRVVTLVDRNSKRARSIIMDDWNKDEVKRMLDDNIVRSATIITDEAGAYKKGAAYFGAHKTVNHAQDEYVYKDDPTVHTNTVEGYFSVFKRGMRGTYQHCSKRHLPRYADEFDFRYSNRAATGVDDQERADRILAGVKGKRLTYGPANERRSRTEEATT